MAITFLESGSDATQGLEFFTVTAGTVASTTAQFRTGPRSISCSSGAGATAATVQADVIADAGGRVSVAMRLTTLPSATTRLVSCNNTSIPASVFQLRVTSAGVLQIWNNTAQIGSSGSTITTGVWYRFSLAWTVSSTTINEIRFWLNGTLDITISNATLSNTGMNRLQMGLGLGVTANIVAHLDDIYADDSTALTEPASGGDLRVCYKAPGTVNANNFDTTNGTGAVNERPISATNGKTHAASTSVSQNYTLQDAATGDVNITGATLLGYGGFIYASRTGAAGTGSSAITVNGADTAITLTTSDALFTNYTASSSYPSNAAGIGMVSTNTTDDTNLHECGVVIAFIAAMVRLRTLMGAGV